MTARPEDPPAIVPEVLPRERSERQAIADAISAAYKAQYGRGPESIKVHLNPDSVLAVLRGGFSIVEESLRKAGRSEAVRDQRRAFGDMIAPTLGVAVSEVLGREVVAVLADTCQDPDLGAIVLVLERP
ncbi:Na-translocating system protein MpsC family protein [Patulibacter minatonensis]|uniref:Na-translocating system protein MpsC family protein n=1 Tax=Patulibacter minatonensis TaxID=298163 RepID=UPI00047C2BBF|nr:Na-translocating system protein MpsC family protein [Patulibacter minatonensis]